MSDELNIHRNPSESQVKHLLAEAELPASDLTSKRLETFFGCGPMEALTGVVGLEIYGKVALLRSLAVSRKSRGKGYGKALVSQAEGYAQSQGVTEIYLLTTTAGEFFEQLGYRRVDREGAPGAIGQTQEFSALCPSNSAFMVKALPANNVSRSTR